MANWLLDYIEMTEYIPSELREQLTSIRELDLQVHNAMDELERDIKQFFSKINTLSSQERQNQYEAFLKKFDVATQAASNKVKVADKLHDLVEKSMRLLDQGLEKLKEDLLEGDKAYIVEDLERRSLEEDEQARLEQETIIQRSKQNDQDRLQQPQKDQHQLKIHSKGHHHNKHHTNNNESNLNHVNSHQHHHNNHRHSIPAQNHHNHNYHLDSHHTNHRNRHNSTGTQNLTQAGRQKKRERKRLNSTMSIFNRNSRTEDNSLTNQIFLSTPITTPDYLPGTMQNNTNNNIIHSNNSNSSTGIIDGNNTTNSLTTIKGMMAGNRISIGINDKSNGKNDPLAGAKQPILTAIDAAHAVSPNATNSDKLILFSSNAKSDNLNPTHNNNNGDNTRPTNNHLTTTSLFESQQPLKSPYHNSGAGLSNQLLSTVGFSPGDSKLSGSGGSNNISSVISKGGDSSRLNHHDLQHRIAGSGPYHSSSTTALPLSSRHDPIMMAASQAINATQNMTPGRRTSSLKASYAAVNSGRLHNSAPPQPSQQLSSDQHHQQIFDQSSGIVPEVYCKCRSHIQGSSMIACDNSKCKIEWFHYECVGITTPPEGEWYCDECKNSLGIQNNSNNNKQAKLEGVNVV